MLRWVCDRNGARFCQSDLDETPLPVNNNQMRSPMSSQKKKRILMSVSDLSEVCVVSLDASEETSPPAMSVEIEH
jgi:hypothetical protein